MIPYRPGLILVGAASRNVGKTEFACRLIRQTKPAPMAIKVTVEHDEGKPSELRDAGLDYKILEETRADTGKDTARMLAVGAAKAYWLRATREGLAAGFAELMERLPQGAPIVCESNSARELVKPGLFIVIRDARGGASKPSCEAVLPEADQIVGFDGDWDFQPERIAFAEGRWLVRHEATAIILAGGQSRRIGTDKSMLEIGGRPMIAHIAAQLKPMFDEVIVSANERGKYDFLGLAVVPDLEAGQGPLMGIASALGRVRNEICFAMGCDIPTVDYAFVHRMLERAATCDLVMPRSADEKYEPLFAVYRRSVAGPALDILKAGGRRIVELFQRVRTDFLDFEPGDWYRNINTMEDYRAARAQITVDKSPD